MKKEVWGWVMGGDVEGRCGRNSSVARTLKLVCHSVRQSAYSQTQTQVAHSICANVSIFTHTQGAHKKHSFSLHQHKLEEGNILFFVLCHRLIRFHHHSNAFPLSTVFSSFLTSLTLSATLQHCRPSGCFPGNSCFLFVCLSVLPWRKGQGDVGGSRRLSNDNKVSLKWTQGSLDKHLLEQLHHTGVAPGPCSSILTSN